MIKSYYDIVLLWYIKSYIDIGLLWKSPTTIESNNDKVLVQYNPTKIKSEFLLQLSPTVV